LCGERDYRFSNPKFSIAKIDKGADVIARALCRQSGRG
jgi:hypothetical protein